VLRGQQEGERYVVDGVREGAGRLEDVVGHGEGKCRGGGEKAKRQECVFLVLGTLSF
jgi:hypothetical protein